MISTTDSENMTAQKRRLEVAIILARGVLWRIRMPQTADSCRHQSISNRLEVVLKFPWNRVRNGDESAERGQCGTGTQLVSTHYVAAR